MALKSTRARNVELNRAQRPRSHVYCAAAGFFDSSREINPGFEALPGAAPGVPDPTAALALAGDGPALALSGTVPAPARDLLFRNSVKDRRLTGVCCTAGVAGGAGGWMGTGRPPAKYVPAGATAGVGGGAPGATAAAGTAAAAAAVTGRSLIGEISEAVRSAGAGREGTAEGPGLPEPSPAAAAARLASSLAACCALMLFRRCSSAWSCLWKS